MGNESLNSGPMNAYEMVSLFLKSRGK